MFSINQILIKTNSSLIVEFMFIINTDWGRDNWMLIDRFYKSKR